MGGALVIMSTVEFPPPEQIEEDLQEILRELGYAQETSHWPRPGDFPLEIFLIMALVVVMAFILSQVICRTSRRWEPMPSPQHEEEELVERKDYQALRAHALSLAHQGHYRDAVRVAYLSLLILLDAHDVIQFHPSLTNFEYCLTVKAYPFHSLFTRVTQTFNAIFYGNQQATSTHFQQCIEAVSHLEEVLP